MSRKILFFIMSFVFSFMAYAQESTHLDFKGIPINGNIDVFVSQLEKKGFVKKEDFSNGIIMTGTFVGKIAELYILKTANTNTVWKVTVFVDKDASWSRLKSDYKDYVDLFKQKYGSPSDQFEFFKKPYYEGDGYELQALRNEKCFYSTYFKPNEGIIVVDIYKTGEIRFAYEDNVNSDLMTMEKNKSALDDI